MAVLGDDTDEENETLKVNLSNPSGIPVNNVLDGQGDGTIVDRNAPPSLSIWDATRARGGCDLHGHARLRPATVTVNFNTAEATAKAGSDFSARAGTLSFAPGEKEKSITGHRARRHRSRAGRGLLRHHRRRGQRGDHEDRGLGAIEASDQAPPPPTGDTESRTGSCCRTRPPDDPRAAHRHDQPERARPDARHLPEALADRLRGTVELERATRPLLKLGKKTFTVRKGGKGYASIKLSARTLAILRKSKTGTLRAKVIVIVKTNTKKTMRVSPGVITLKGTKAFLLAKPKLPAAPPTQVVVDPKSALVSK